MIPLFHSQILSFSRRIRNVMGRFIAYIASSLDGFIARKDDDVSWLDAWSPAGEDYGFSGFLETVGTAVMGARTYEQILLHPERRLPGSVRICVLTRRYPHAPSDGTVFWHRSPAALAARIRRESGRDVYLAGGGKLISAFLNAGLVDELRLFLVPILLKEGIPLFVDLRQEMVLDLEDSRRFPTGITELRYKPRRPA